MRNDYQITIREAATALGISPSTCRRYLKQGRLQALRETRSDGTERYLISRSSVLEVDASAEARLPAGDAQPLETKVEIVSATEPEAKTLPAGAVPAFAVSVSPEPELVAVAAPVPGNGVVDGDFLAELTESLEREAESHTVVPVEIYRELRQKNEQLLERAARAEGEAASLRNELERARVSERDLLRTVALLEKDALTVRDAGDRGNGPKLMSMFRGIMGKVEG